MHITVGSFITVCLWLVPNNFWLQLHAAFEIYSVLHLHRRVSYSADGRVPQEAGTAESPHTGIIAAAI